MKDGPKECRDCGHERHQAGECPKCNCGESEVVRMTGYPVYAGKGRVAHRNERWGQR